MVVGIWFLAAMLFRGIGSLEPSAGELRDWLVAQSFESLSAAQRRALVERYAERLNRLSMEERREMRRYPEFEESFREMTEEERIYFIEATLPRGIQQMLQAFNKMDQAQRERIIERAMRDLREAEDAAFEQALDEDVAQRIVENGLQIYYQEANSEARLQLAPLMEQLQRRMQRLR